MRSEKAFLIYWYLNSCKYEVIEKFEKYPKDNFLDVMKHYLLVIIPSTLDEWRMDKGMTEITNAVRVNM